MFLLFLAIPVLSAPISASVVCYKNALVWWDMLVFLGSNFIAHAATVPTTAGAKPYDTLLWTIVVLFLPFAGLGRSWGMIKRYVSVHDGDNVQLALARGALVFVARNEKWEPSDMHEELVYIKLPEGLKRLDEINEQTAESSTVALYAVHNRSKNPRDPIAHTEVDLSHCNFNGEMKLPRGYTWAAVNIPFGLYIMKTSLEPTKGIMLARSQSWLKMAVSIAQLLAASITIYRSRGDQLYRYGYAAYGLTVIPYAIMTAANFMAMYLISDYPCIYVLRTSIVEEAAKRPDGLFDGVIGTLKRPRFPQPPERPLSTAKSEADVEPCSVLESHAPPDASLEKHITQLEVPPQNLRASFGASAESLMSSMDPGWVAAHLMLDARTHYEGTRMLIVRVGETVRRFKYTTNVDAAHVTYRFGIGSVTNEDVPVGALVNVIKTRFMRVPVIWRRRILTWGFLFLAFVLPYILLLVLTGFKRQSSTPSERAWTLAWLCASQVSYIPFARHAEGAPYTSLNHLIWRGWPFLLFTTLMMVAAVGGYVVAGKMFIQDNNGLAQCS
ncbi:uncharacterized protein FIBRA_06264 [Fibroporia radiculosa]|uniref:DUF3533 domain-containing protein n=1 Tax=Fibroporia radiculosa TaxID=599839 RepID=J4H3Z5_9APHY|nr:uncharacterized protein FIBRA_06264 [Fibroporia radiculosa]CCM04104.1 predicted protein [Fibroporia radiculosa]